MLKSMMLATTRFAPLWTADDGGAAGENKAAADGAADDKAAAGAADDKGGDDKAAAGVADDKGGDDAAAGAADDKGGDDKAAAAAAGAPDWRDREIGRKHRQLLETRQRAETLAAENETLRAIAEGRIAPKPDGDGAGAAPQGDMVPRDQVQAEAQRIASVALTQKEFDNAANDAHAAGVTRYKDDWKKATDTLATLGGFDLPTMQSILATDDPAQVLYELGSKPAEFQRIMDLPPARRQTELVKLGLKQAKAVAAPSRAPAPVNGINPQSRTDITTLSDDLDDDTWYERRVAQKAARFAAKQAAARG